MSTGKDLQISSLGTGKSVSFAPTIKADAVALKRAAREGYYYPMLALKQLKELASGPIGKSNVYIPNINDSRAHTFQMFYVIFAWNQGYCRTST